MSTITSVSFQRSGVALFSPEEIERLMRVELERARRHRHALACMMIQVDRIDQLAAVHGFQARDEIVQGVVDVLRSETRAGDFLGTVLDGRICTLHPHTRPEGAIALAKRVLENARRMTFPLNGVALRATLSIGLSNTARAEETSFETLLEVATEGAKVADAAGGDRFAETELYGLYESKRRRQGDRPAPAAAQDQERAPAGGGRFVFARGGEPVHAAVPDPVAELPAPMTDEELASRARLRELVITEGSLERAVARMAEDIVGRALSELQAERQAVSQRDGDYQREIDILERRVAKLSRSLGLTEDELRRLRVLKNVDDGLSSIFRDVQGLSQEDPHRELKRECMERIFAANLDLKREIGQRRGA